MIRAPIVATLTSRSMPTTLAVSARAALITIGVPATAAAATIKMLPTSSEPDTLATTNEATINSPEIVGIVHRPFLNHTGEVPIWKLRGPHDPDPVSYTHLRAHE